jgi:uncharacterized lipoprotein YajG
MTSCAFIDQNVKITPSVEVAKSNIGNGRTVGIKVVDEREDSLIGKRGSAYGDAAAIKTDQDMVELFSVEISRGFENKGFEPVPYLEEIPVYVKVEIRSVEYDTSMGLWTAGNMANSAIKVIAYNESKNYEKMYRSQVEIRTAFVASQETNAKIINQAVSDVIEKMFQDEDLLSFLAK